MFVRRARPRLGVIRAARPSGRTDHAGTRAGRELSHVLGQRKLFQKALPGLMHAFIFWGFLVLLPTIVEAAVAIVSRTASLPLIGDAAWFALIADVFATLVVVGVAIAFWIRKVQRPDRFDGSHMGEADRILLMILAIVVSLLLWNASRIAIGTNGWPASWSPVSNALSGIFRAMPSSAARAAERALAWTHVLLVLGFLAYAEVEAPPFLTAAPNVYLAKNGPSGRLEPLRIDLEGPGPAFRGRRRHRPVAQADARSLLVHGVRPMSGGLPRVEHRQAAVAEAAHHGSARPRRRAVRRDPRRGRRRGVVELQPLVPAAVSDEIVWTA